MENKTNSKITLEKFHNTLTGKDSFYVGISSEIKHPVRSEWFETIEKAEDYYQKAIDNNFVGMEEEILKEYSVGNEDEKDLITLEAEFDVAYDRFRHVVKKNGNIIFSSTHPERAKQAYGRFVETNGELFTYQKIDSSIT